LKTDSFWLSANSLVPNKGWTWSNNDPFIFVNWAQGEYETGKNQYCAVVSNYLNGQWKTVNCETNDYGYICEKQQTGFTTKPSVTETTKASVQYGCQPDWYYFKNNYCYKYFDDLRTFDEAKASCQKKDAELVEIFNDGENEFVSYVMDQAIIKTSGDDGETVMNANLSDVEQVWMGMYDTLVGFNQVSFKWNSGKTPLYTNWANSQPEIHAVSDASKCVSLIRSDKRKTDIYGIGQWIVTDCDYKLSYACRKPLGQIESTMTSTLKPGCEAVSTVEIAQGRLTLIRLYLSCLLCNSKGYKGYEDDCYIVLNEYKSWQDADLSCQQENARLVTIRNRFLQYWLSNTLLNGQFQSVWIGLSDFQFTGFYEWVNKEPVSYTNWDKDEPSKCSCLFFLIRKQILTFLCLFILHDKRIRCWHWQMYCDGCVKWLLVEKGLRCENAKHLLQEKLVDHHAYDKNNAHNETTSTMPER
jgi:hypothetical protein